MIFLLHMGQRTNQLVYKEILQRLRGRSFFLIQKRHFFLSWWQKCTDINFLKLLCIKYEIVIQKKKKKKKSLASK